MSQVETNRPLFSLDVGPYSASIWANSYDAGDGTQRVVKSVTLRKAFFNKKTKAVDHQSLSMNLSEVGSVVGLLSEMERALIVERRNGDTSSEPAGADIPF